MEELVDCAIVVEGIVVVVPWSVVVGREVEELVDCAKVVDGIAVVVVSRIVSAVVERSCTTPSVTPCVEAARVVDVVVVVVVVVVLSIIVGDVWVEVDGVSVVVVPFVSCWIVEIATVGTVELLLTEATASGTSVETCTAAVGASDSPSSDTGGLEAKMVANSVSCSVGGAGATVVVLLNPVVPALSSVTGVVSAGDSVLVTS